LQNLHINPYEMGNRYNVEQKRKRKLLLHKREVRKITGLCTQKGYTLIPLRLYFRGQNVKVELGLARGKQNYDKRNDIRDRDSKRDMERAIKNRD
jgi:SsrA-binding protein